MTLRILPLAMLLAFTLSACMATAFVGGAPPAKSKSKKPQRPSSELPLPNDKAAAGYHQIDPSRLHWSLSAKSTKISLQQG